MVFWYVRTRAINAAATRVEYAGSDQELPQLAFQISVLCTPYARSGDNHHIPSQWHRPDIYCFTNPSLRAIALNCGPNLLTCNYAQTAPTQPVWKYSHH